MMGSIRDQLGHHLDVIWGSFGGHIGIMWTSSGDHLGPFEDHLGPFGDHLGIIWGSSGDRLGPTGRNRSKFGNFDTGRCASISGPRKSRFWPTIPIFVPMKSFRGSFLSLSRQRRQNRHRQGSAAATVLPRRVMVNNRTNGSPPIGRLREQATSASSGKR